MSGAKSKEAISNLKNKFMRLPPVLYLPRWVEDFKDLNYAVQQEMDELFSDYECEIRYHPGKENVMADALSRKERVKPRRVRAYGNGAIKWVEQQMEKRDDGSLSVWMYMGSFGRVIEDYSMERLARIYIDKIVARHGVPVSIISDRDGRFTSRCWQTVQKALGTRLDMSTAYHPQMDGQNEFSYNNCYHSSLDVLCLKQLRRKCRSPVLWAEIGESSLIGPELVQETTDKVVLIKEKLKAARDRQKSYADNRRKPLEFEVGDRVMLKVSPWKGVIHFGKKGKLAPRYVGPFEILERVGPIAYRLRLLEELSGVHDTFHVSNLKKCLADASLQLHWRDKVDQNSSVLLKNS
ncbi:putative reverse transcriptase domain-containing protein [Tanacetum coccineum]